MIYFVDFTEVAELEVQDILFWIIGRFPNRARTWQEGFERTVQSLSQFPKRCQVYQATPHQETVVRQHLYGRYRILFTLVDTDGDGVDDTVRILHVRHGARRDPCEEDQPG